MALAGAEVLIYPTAIGWDVTDDPEEQARQLDAWVTVQRGHAVANNLPVIAPNRVGTEPDPSGNSDGIRFWGNSFICGPQENSWPVPTTSRKPYCPPPLIALAVNRFVASGRISGIGASTPTVTFSSG